jgi:hypothetical protein
MATQLTWSDIAKYVASVITAEGAEPSYDFIRTLGNQSLGVISEHIGPITTYWDNSATDLTITDNYATLPIDCISVDSVEWDGDDNPITRTTEAQLDFEEPGWRSETGDPDKYAIAGNILLLNCAPSNATGKLVVRGKRSLPDFSDTAGATNPLTYLPSSLQLIPAYYIIAMHPVVPVAPTDDSVEAITYARQQTQRRYETRDRYEAMWQRGLDQLQVVNNRRRNAPFTY